jgi:hypothetical protein
MSTGPVRAALLLACFVPWLAAAAGADPPAGGQQTLQSCAAISAPSERLVCYDALAQRPAAGAAAAAAGPAASTAAVPGSPTPPVAVAPARPSAIAPGSQEVVAPAAAAPVAGASPSGAEGTSAPGLTPSQAFGLYNAEHISITSKIQSITARVVGMHTGARGYPVVDLDGGQSWALADADPLLAVGDTVTIRRAAFDSFLLTTPTKRTHRVQRLR